MAAGTLADQNRPRRRRGLHAWRARLRRRDDVQALLAHRCCPFHKFPLNGSSVTDSLRISRPIRTTAPYHAQTVPHLDLSTSGWSPFISVRGGGRGGAYQKWCWLTATRRRRTRRPSHDPVSSFIAHFISGFYAVFGWTLVVRVLLGCHIRVCDVHVPVEIKVELGELDA